EGGEMVGWRRVLVGIACLVACGATVVGDELRLAGYLSDHAVLQADRPITIRGWADAEAGVRVTLGEEAIRTQADAAGRWDVVFSPRPASGEPLTLRVTA